MEFQPTPSTGLPHLTHDNRAYWTGGEKGQLLIQRCADCEHYVHPPFPVCNRCRSRNVPPVAVSGRGSVYTFTVNEQQWAPWIEVPYVVAMVELVEEHGLWLMTNIVNCDAASVHVGMPVKVLFRQVEDIWLPLFEPE